MALLDSLPNVGILVISAVVLYFATHAIYSLYFHPLSKHPGPLLNAISPLPRLWLNINGREPQTVLKWHLKYGLERHLQLQEARVDQGLDHVCSF
jgi:hypothetical protein